MEQVRTDTGRPNDLGDHSGLKVATILKNDNWRLKRELDGRCIRRPVPWNMVKRGKAWDLPEDAAFSFFGKNLYPWIKDRWKEPWGEEGLTIEQRLDRALGTYDWIIENKPDVLVVWTDAYPEARAACMAMRALDKPVVEVVHGAFHVYWHGHFETKPFATWKLGSWEYRAWHNFYGLDCNVAATGLPNMDVWAGNDTERLRETARHELQIPKVATVVTYLGDTAFERNAWMDPGLAEGALIQFLKDWRTARKIIPNPYLIFKQHPYDRSKTLEYYKGLVEDIAGITDNYTLVDDNLALALAPADVLVGPRSSAMISGLMLGIPSLVVDFTPFFDEHNYRGMGFDIAREPAEVLSKLVHITTDMSLMSSLIDQTQKGSAWFSGAQDGQASDRAADAILAVAMGAEVETLAPLP